MKRATIAALLLFSLAIPSPEERQSFRDLQWKYPRVRTASREKDEVLRQRFKEKGVAYPPHAILLRAFKKEAVLELWATDSEDKPLVLVHKYSICTSSGVLGPKRRFGDEQVPEGFYEFDWFNPQSNFYLSLHISYPNTADRILGSRQNLGGDIFLHGNCASIGCIPITDEGIKKFTGSPCWYTARASNICRFTFSPRGLRRRVSRHCPRATQMRRACWISGATSSRATTCLKKRTALPASRLGQMGPTSSPIRGLPRKTGEARNALRTRISLRSRVFAAICYDSCMRKAAAYSMVLVLCAFGFAGASRPQSNSGTLEFLARVTPTAARPEPVRQFTFYVLTKSYTEIVKEVEDKDPLPPRNEFIETLKISPELKSWLKEHEILDLTMPDTDKAITPEDIMRVPEFQAAYERSNSGGVTDGFPRPKYTEAEKTEHPDKYEKHKQEYTLALKKFVQTHPGTISGVELELDAVNPQKKWAILQSAHHKRVQRTAPDMAQTRFLAGKADTDLEGRAAVSGLPPGKYWISTINLDAAAGDMRLRWDVPVMIQAGQTTRVELTNLNSIDAHGENP